jgi:hypothetical protein
MASSRPTECDAEIEPSSDCLPLDATGVAKPLAPEDIRAGDYVAILDEIYELPSYCWFGDSALHPREELVRIRMVPTRENLPLKVKSVCLPFVLAKHPVGEKRTLDLRRCRLARLDSTYATAAWKAFKKRHGTKKRAPHIA